MFCSIVVNFRKQYRVQEPVQAQLTKNPTWKTLFERWLSQLGHLPTARSQLFLRVLDCGPACGVNLYVIFYTNKCLLVDTSWVGRLTKVEFLPVRKMVREDTWQMVCMNEERIRIQRWFKRMEWVWWTKIGNIRSAEIDDVPTAAVMTSSHGVVHISFCPFD